LGAAGSYLAFVAGAAIPLSSALIRPKLRRVRQLRSRHLRRFLAARRIKFEEVTFSSFDGTKLDGWWFEAGRDRPTVIALHGVTKNRTDVIRFAITLQAAQMNVLIFDGRGHGSSEKKYVTYGYFERRDVEAAMEFLVRERRIDERRLGLAGVSMGAAISLQVAAANRRIRAVWTDSPFASLTRISLDRLQFWTRLPEHPLRPVMWVAMKVAERRGRFVARAVNPLGLASRISCPVYLVHGEADALIGPQHSRSIFDALASRDKELWIIPGVGHGRGFRRKTSEYAERLVAFFRNAFGEV
jgi:dipeptidyl aminopeptidase/acylaminoacyl peptidase